MSTEIKGSKVTYTGYPCQFASVREGSILCRRGQVYQLMEQLLEDTAVCDREPDYHVTRSEVAQQLRIPCFMRERDGVTICGASLDRNNNPVSAQAALSRQIYGTGYKRAGKPISIEEVCS